MSLSNAPASARILPFPPVAGARRAALFDRLHCYVQPIIDLRRGAIVGIEFLARAHSSQDTVLSPRQFLPVLLACGELADLDLQMARKLSEFHDRQRRVTDRPLALHLNLCPETIIDERFVQRLAECFIGNPELANEVVIEVVEDPGLGAAGLTHLRYLRSLGLRIAIDDFGTGYSSFQRLSELSFDIIKLDKSLVHGLTDCPRKQAIAASLIGLASEFGVDLIAEGVESAAQKLILGEMGCRFAQGYYWGRPLPASRMLQHLRTENGCPPSGAARRWLQ